MSKPSQASSKSPIDGIVRAALGRFWAGYVAARSVEHSRNLLILLTLFRSTEHGTQDAGIFRPKDKN